MLSLKHESKLQLIKCFHRFFFKKSIRFTQLNLHNFFLKKKIAKGKQESNKAYVDTFYFFPLKTEYSCEDKVLDF